ncbi:MAG: class I SAM-dependent methyltransferase [bacterium]|nr:class I SAM-dependent methyltransferase [bacterium]
MTVAEPKDTRVSRGFDRLAPVYDLLAAVGSGNQIARARRSLLNEIPPGKRALVLGDGTGQFLCELMATGRVKQAVCIDASPAMIDRASRRWQRQCRRSGADPGSVEFRVGALPLDDGPGGPYDLVCTNFFLDLFTNEEMEPVFRQIDAALAPDGNWYYTDFRYPDRATHPLRYLSARVLVRCLYVFFGLVAGLRARALTDVKKTFESNEYQLVARTIVAFGALECAIFKKARHTF